MRRKCHICGEIKKTTFNCSRCNGRTCLNCYNFLEDMCYDCVSKVYNEKYKAEIEKYAKA